jgi:alpha-galactosidase
MAEQPQGHAAHSKAAETGILESVPRPLKIVYLGSGSTFFARLFVDLLHIPGADRGELVAVDVDPERLELSAEVGKKIVEAFGADWKVTATDDRREVLAGADYVICSIEVHGVDSVASDYEIPARYGVFQCIGDTVGPGGLLKALRTVPEFLDILGDIEELCPDAWVLNYTNPMSIMCLAAARASTAKVAGLCHSVQGTSKALASYADVPYEEMIWACAGINHLAWFTRLEHKGEDLYPRLLKRVEDDPGFIENDPVRLDMMKHFGYFITESSGHLSEYLPYYRKNEKCIAEYCRERYKGESGFYARNWPSWREGADNQRRRIIAGEDKIAKGRSWEYASWIIQAMETNAPFVAYTTLPNDALIDNLPADNVVEVASLCDRNGIHGVHYGELPPQCAAVCESNLRMIDLAAIACVEDDREAAVHALMLDPLTSAICTPAQIRDMAEELFAAEADYLRI